jgi:hypothetical protein
MDLDEARHAVAIKAMRVLRSCEPRHASAAARYVTLALRRMSKDSSMRHDPYAAEIVRRLEKLRAEVAP